MLIHSMACPASCLSRNNYDSPSTQGMRFPPSQPCVPVHLLEQSQLMSPQLGKQGMTPPVEEVPKVHREMGPTCFPYDGNCHPQNLLPESQIRDQKGFPVVAGRDGKERPREGGGLNRSHSFGHWSI